jgi:hypothetical protein
MIPQKVTPDVLKHAIDLGIAMQLTNIARDVADDFKMGRIYLPLQWLHQKQIPLESLLDLQYRTQLLEVVDRLLKEAKKYYFSGDLGLKYLPFRSRVAAAVASQVYSKIGDEVLRRGEQAWSSRTVVSKMKKILVFGIIFLNFSQVIFGQDTTSKVIILLPEPIYIYTKGMNVFNSSKTTIYNPNYTIRDIEDKKVFENCNFKNY